MHSELPKVTPNTRSESSSDTDPETVFTQYPSPNRVSAIDPYSSRRHSLVRRPEVRSPLSGSFFATMVLVAFPLLVVAFLFMPWQQSAIGVGAVTTFDPMHRPQKIEAPIEGVVQQWYVSEGSMVRAGDPLLELRDNDPERLNRLTNSESLGASQIESLVQKKTRYQSKLTAEQQALDQKIEETKNKLQSLREKRIGVEAEWQTESLQFERYTDLLAEGIVSQRDYELSKLKRDKAAAVKEAVQAEIRGAESRLAAVTSEKDAKLATIQAEIDEIDVKLSATQQKQLEIQSKVVKQRTQTVLAPQDGFVFRIVGGIQGEQIKKGEALIQFVPLSTDRVVELFIDGNDASLLALQQEVRLVFEGWPALQFVGFPGADAGTFAGVVQTIDPLSDKKGQFRVLVAANPAEHEWPVSERLRLGTRVKGFVMLGTVPLGYEIWRRINGFPALPAVDKGDKVTLPSSKKVKKPSLMVP